MGFPRGLQLPSRAGTDRGRPRGRSPWRRRRRLHRVGQPRGDGSRSAPAGKTQILELGGNGPMVVLEDADLELAADATLEAAYLCAGQSCTAGERFLVHSSVRAEFVDRVLAATASKVRLGDPFETSTTMGPLNNEANAVKFDAHLADARERGAVVRCGGSRAAGFPTRSSPSRR